MKYVWLTNVLNPNNTAPETALIQPDPAIVEEGVWQRWLSVKAIGDPRPADGLSAEQLKAQGYVGVYKLI
jgi:hypothetical protein